MTEDPRERERLFVERLETFRQEGAQCAQFLYSYLTIHAVAAKDENVRRGLNEEALFWNTVLGGLQCSLFIVLGRVFDPSSKHGIASLLKFATECAAIFQQEALAHRKGEDYAADARIPGPQEFVRMERLVAGYSERYNNDYRELRNRVFAHRVYTGDTVGQLFSRTNINELEQMVTFLDRFYRAWFNSFHNGSRLTLGRARHSVQQMLERPRGRSLVKPVQEEMTAATQRALAVIALPPVIPGASV
jgi:hypothetical protein